MCRNIALAGQPGRIRFTLSLDTQNHAVPMDGAPVEMESIEVPVERLDDLCRHRSPILIKIDVEGYEPHVLEGAREVLQSADVWAVIIELNGSGTRYGWNDDDTAQMLLDRGFSMVEYDPFRRMLTTRPIRRRDPGNVIFVRGLEAVQERCQTSPAYQILGRRI